MPTTAAAAASRSSGCPPAPPAALGKDPLVYSWDVGLPLIRSHPQIYGETQFYQGRPGGARFSSFVPVGERDPLPVLYAAGTADAALSETVLHDVPVRGDKRIARSDADGMQLSQLDIARPLILADLTSVGLRRLGVSRSELIESDRRCYPFTALWARAIHAHTHSDGFKFDGLVWVSRQHDTSLAVVLFGGQVASDYDIASGKSPAPDITTATGSDALPLAFGPGKEMLDLICERADITIVEP